MYVTKEKARGAEPREPYKSKSVFFSDGTDEPIPRKMKNSGAV